MLHMEPTVYADRDRESVHLGFELTTGFVIGVAFAAPLAAEECDAALAWADRAEAALDNYRSEVELVRDRMLAGRRAAAADPSLGAGGSVEAYRG